MDKEILANLDNPDELFKILDKCVKTPIYEDENEHTDTLTYELSEYDRNKRIRNHIHRGIYKLIDTNTPKSINYAITILKQLENKEEDYSLNSLKVRAYSMTKETLEDAVEITETLPNTNKRLYMPLLSAYIKWFPEKAFAFLYQIHDLFVLSYEDIKVFVFDIDRTTRNKKFKTIPEQLFDIISKYEIELEKPIMKKLSFQLQNEDQCSKCMNKLNRIVLTRQEIYDIKSSFYTTYFNTKPRQNAVRSFENFCGKRDFNVFVDGNNLLYYADGHDKQVKFTGYLRLQNAYKQLKSMGLKPLITLHERHGAKNMSYLKKQFPKRYKIILNILKKLDMYYTPKSNNDDWFFIWGGIITSNAYIMSNDKFRDHIFSVSEDKFKKYFKQLIIEYEVVSPKDRRTIVIKMPAKVTRCAQKIKNFWHIPIASEQNDQWICVNTA